MDPVAVLAIFEEIGVNMVLYFLVFGESLLNDGVTIVFYNTFVALKESDNVGVGDYFMGMLSFVAVVVGGLAIGIIMGALSALIVRTTKVGEMLYECYQTSKRLFSTCSSQFCKLAHATQRTTVQG